MNLQSLKAQVQKQLDRFKPHVDKALLFLKRQSLFYWNIFIKWPPKKRAVVVGSVFGGIILLWILISSIVSYIENQELLKAQNAPIPVITAKVQNVTAPQSIDAVGNMQAILSVPVSFNATGVISKIYVKDGEQVKKGQLIAALDSRGDMAQLQSYQANLALQKANYQRMLSIRNSGAISQQMLDSQKALWQQAVAQVNQQQLFIEQKSFYAPFDGVLSNFSMSSGSYLAQGTAIATLVQEAPLVVQFTLPVSDRPQIELGQPVTVTSAAYPNQVFSGVLSYASPVASSTSGTMALQATIPNPDFLLLPGMFVSVSELVNPNRQLPMVPDVALMSDIVGQYVFKVEGDHVHKVYVTVGQSIGNLVPINTGLLVGDTVVIAGQQKLNDGTTVTDLDDPKLVSEVLNDTYGADS